MQLPIFKDDNTNLVLMETKWASIINPVLSIPYLNKPSILSNIILASGDNVINTKLGRKAQGWMVTDVNAAVSIYRSAAFNDLTLTLNSSGTATVSLVIF